MLDAPLANGALPSNGHSAPDSPVADSPATPVNNAVEPDVKIDVDFTGGESDVRHEPMPMKLTKLEDASVVPEAGTPVDAAALPIDPPKGTPPPPTGQLLEDVQMAEQQALPIKDGDANMAEAAGQTNGLSNGHAHLESPAATPMSSSIPAVSSSETAVDTLGHSSPYPNNKHSNEHDDDDEQPPTKRARKHSDADKASLANTATTPPASASPDVVKDATPPRTGSPTLSVAQWRFATSTIRTLKKIKEAVPFLHPVDPVALNIPHYPSIIKHPMDLSTIDRKLLSSNPLKPDPHFNNPRYFNADEFVADVRLMFSNCLTFNGPDHPVTMMGKRVEAVFDKQIKQMPPAEEVKPVPVKKATPPPPPPPPKKVPVRRPSMTATPVIRRSDDNVGRPKREIHPPPPKDLPYADAPKKPRKAKLPKDDLDIEQLRFCEKVLKELHKKSHWNIAHPFYEPVDWVKLDIPAYPRLIKKPMDLSTIKRKLTNGEYTTADKFRDDFKLMIKNCFIFNPAKNPVHEAGKELDRVFDQKWAELPTPRLPDMSDDDDEDDEEEEDDTDSERARMIAKMESQIQTMRSSLDSLKRKGKDVKKEKKKKDKASPPIASTSKAPSKPSKSAATSNGRKKGKKPITDDDVLSFEQKKDLSDTIAKLDGQKLEKVIQIIHEGVPEIRDSTEEIELEIDQLPAAVLTKLYNFVIRPIKAAQPKRARTGKGTGTGGLKRKSMDEDVEAAKIRALEARMKLFEQGADGGAGDLVGGEESDHSSAESSDESSASDSE